jgi:hypothetical protein
MWGRRSPNVECLTGLVNRARAQTDSSGKCVGSCRFAADRALSCPANPSLSPFAAGGAHPLARRHQLIKSCLERHGQYKPIVVRVALTAERYAVLLLQRCPDATRRTTGQATGPPRHSR